MSTELSRFTAWFSDHFNIDTPVERLWFHIKSELLNLLDKYVPSKVVKNSNTQPWVYRYRRYNENAEKPVILTWLDHCFIHLEVVGKRTFSVT